MISAWDSHQQIIENLNLTQYMHLDDTAYHNNIVLQYLKQLFDREKRVDLYYTQSQCASENHATYQAIKISLLLKWWCSSFFSYLSMISCFSFFWISCMILSTCCWFSKKFWCWRLSWSCSLWRVLSVISKLSASRTWSRSVFSKSISKNRILIWAWRTMSEFVEQFHLQIFYCWRWDWIVWYVIWKSYLFWKILTIETEELLFW